MTNNYMKNVQHLQKKNAVKTIARFHFTLVRTANIKIQKIINSGKDVGEKEPSHTAGAGGNELSCCGNQCGGSSGHSTEAHAILGTHLKGCSRHTAETPHTHIYHSIDHSSPVMGSA